MAHPKKHPATGTSDGKKTEKTAYTGHLGRMLSGKLFFFLRMADAIQKADGELRSFKKIRKHLYLSTGMLHDIPQLRELGFVLPQSEGMVPCDGEDSWRVKLSQ